MNDLELEQQKADRGESVAVRTIEILRSLRELCRMTGVDFDALLDKSRERE